MFLKQVMMRRVVYSLLPIFAFSIYLYGFLPLTILIVSCLTGFLTELFFQKLKNKEKGKVTEAVFVTSFLFALSMPPNMGRLENLWIVSLGMIVAIVFGKEVYGGFGRNVFNPAITGRLFVYLSFPTHLTTTFVEPGNWGAHIDTITKATPISTFAEQGVSFMDFSVLDLILGLRSGTIGESNILLILLAAIYLVYTKTAQLKLILSTLISALITVLTLNILSSYFGIGSVIADPITSLFVGSIFFVAVFMSTDPVSAPKNSKAQIIYGIIIGSVSMIIRIFSGYAEGVSFGIIIANTFSSFLDKLLTKKKPVAKKS